MWGCKLEFDQNRVSTALNSVPRWKARGLSAFVPAPEYYPQKGSWTSRLGRANLSQRGEKDIVESSELQA